MQAVIRWFYLWEGKSYPLNSSLHCCNDGVEWQNYNGGQFVKCLVTHETLICHPKVFWGCYASRTLLKCTILLSYFCRGFPSFFFSPTDFFLKLRIFLKPKRFIWESLEYQNLPKGNPKSSQANPKSYPKVIPNQPKVTQTNPRSTQSLPKVNPKSNPKSTQSDPKPTQDPN